MRLEQPCSVDGCETRVRCRGLCERHYNSWRRYRDPLRAGTLKTPHGAAKAFLRSVLDGSAQVEPNGCILWPYSTNCGYAQIGTPGDRPVHVGRLVLEHFVGPAPTPEHTMGHALHEVCGNRHCVAPAHLSWQTPKEQSQNMKDDGTLRPACIYLGVEHNKARHTDDEVAAAVARVRAGETQRAVAADIGVNVSSLKRWVHGEFRKAAVQ